MKLKIVIVVFPHFPLPYKSDEGIDSDCCHRLDFQIDLEDKTVTQWAKREYLELSLWASRAI
jgi:hypothetical protein